LGKLAVTLVVLFLAPELASAEELLSDPPGRVNFWSDPLGNITNSFNNWVSGLVTNTINFFQEKTIDSTNWLFRTVFTLIADIVLWTPSWLFENEWFPQSIRKFSALNILLVSLLSMVEGIKRMVRVKTTAINDMLKRLPIAISVSAFAPFLFATGVNVLNHATDFIVNLGMSQVSNTMIGDATLFSVASSTANLVAMGIFIILLIRLCIPLILHHGKRWFDMVSLGVLTPFAMTAFVFDDYRHYFHQWLNSLKKLSLVQLVYAVFLAILGLIMFATPTPMTFHGLVAKLLLLLGGIYRLAYPPSIVERMTDSGRDTMGVIEDIKNSTKDGIETIKKGKKNAENAAIKSASIAGKVWRFLK
jgi:hypothetical protein